MKFLSFLCCLCFLTSVKGQERPDSNIFYTGVVIVDSVSGSELALRARQWFTTTFKNPKDVIVVSDIENGQVSGKGSFQYAANLKMYGTEQMMHGFITVKISIFTKDNRYKYEIGPFAFETYQSAETGYFSEGSSNISSSNYHPSAADPKMKEKNKAGLNKWWQEVKKQVETNGEAFKASLLLAMHKNYKGDW